MAILKHIASKSSNYGAALEYLIFKHDELRKTPILDQNGNRIMRDEFYLDGLNCEPYSFDATCQQLNREYQKNKNKNEIKSHHYIISFDPRDSTENCLTGKRAQELGNTQKQIFRGIRHWSVRTWTGTMAAETFMSIS